MPIRQAPNHHADHPGFRGVSGLVAALSMAIGRQGDARLAVRLSGLQRGQHVVDVGCGPGVAVRHAARIGAVAVGVDPAPVMRRVARLLTSSAAPIRYEAGTAEDIPLGDHAVAVVWSIATVHHWTDLDAGLREARRVLEPGGCFVAVERRVEPGARGHGSHGWTDLQAHAFAEQCAATGFVDVRLDTARRGRRLVVSVVARSPR